MILVLFSTFIIIFLKILHRFYSENVKYEGTLWSEKKNKASSLILTSKTYCGVRWSL